MITAALIAEAKEKAITALDDAEDDANTFHADVLYLPQEDKATSIAARMCMHAAVELAAACDDLPF